MVFKFPDEVIDIIKKLQSGGFEAYVVGGAVRDLIQGKAVTDWDFTTDATPEEIIKLFPGSFYDNKFGTVGVPIKRTENREQRTEEVDVYEITTFRTEQGYSDKRRPDRVEWGKSLQEDLSRRDFTVNAMALKTENRKQKTKSNKQSLRAEGRQTSRSVAISCSIIDPFGGQKDLENKIIRAVGDANATGVFD